MMTLIQDTLALWQDAESILERLPPAAPEHETVQRLVVELRATYARLTTAREWTRAELERSRESIRDARALLARVEVGGGIGTRRPDASRPTV